MSDLKKICSKCNIAKALDEFNFRQKSKEIRHAYCKDCGKLLTKSHYQRNKKQYMDKNLRSLKKRREFVQKMKNKPCADCGIVYPYYVMDFDHRENETKEFGLHKVTQKALGALKREIEKCDVVCANCHRERTHQRSLRRKETETNVSQVYE
jgi:hypothetical protein